MFLTIDNEKFKKYVSSLEVSKSLDGFTAREVDEAKALVDKAWLFYRDIDFTWQRLKMTVRMCRECRKHESCDECLPSEECSRREDFEFYTRLADLGLETEEGEESEGENE